MAKSQSQPPQTDSSWRSDFRNTSIPREQRISDLVSRLTLEEKVGLLIHRSPGIERLGIPPYNYWNECLHGVGRAGRATVFPQAIALAATFHPPLIREIAQIIAVEARIKYYAALRAGNHGQYRGISFWAPNINIFRDPRWGRGQETYGEDPFLTASIGSAFVLGLQGENPDKLTAAACAKHYAVHSGPEGKRHRFDVHPTKKDLAETYLAAFEALVRSGVEAIMGAYNRVYGEPACGSTYLLQEILRDRWGFRGHVVSDCWALWDFHAHHRVTPNPRASSIKALRAGCDLNCGDVYPHLIEAVASGELDESEIDVALRRVLDMRFKLGMFDPIPRDDDSTYSKQIIACKMHLAKAREAATLSIVLLKNHDQILPLEVDSAKNREIYVVGPTATSHEVLLGNYNGYTSQGVTILEGLIGAVDESVSIQFRTGVWLNSANTQPRDFSIEEAKEADVVIAVMGVSPLQEGEEGEAILSKQASDRKDIELHEAQRSYLKSLYEAGSRVILILTGGSPIALAGAEEYCEAILFVWYPGEQGGAAVADIIFGHANPSGRLPITFPRSIDDLPDYEEYAMTGRTYRYATTEPLFPFGYGLSYTSFAYESGEAELLDDGSVEVRATIYNTGDVAGREVVQVYWRKTCPADDAPKWSLAGISSVEIDAGGRSVARVKLESSWLRSYDSEGIGRVLPGEYELSIGGCSPGARGQQLGAARPLCLHFNVAGPD